MAYQKRSISQLGQFLGTYLGQDWDAEFPDAWSAVQGFVELEPLDRRIAARAELEQVLQSSRTEAELSLAMDRVRMNYHPPGEGFTYREWLEKVERYLREHEV